RAAAIAAAVLIPLAWLVPDLVGAGNPLEGGETARAGGIEPLDGLEVLGRALAAPLAAAWVGLALLLWREGRELEQPLKVLLAGAGAWIALVALMAVGGWAGLPRFLAPATAVLAVLGAVGIARAAAAPLPESAGPYVRYAELKSGGPSFQTLRGLLVVALVLAVAGFGWRAAQLPGDLEVVERQKDSVDQLFELVEETGKAPLLACGGTVRMTRVREQTALAWKLEEPIASVPVRRKPHYGVVLSTKPMPSGNVIAQVGPWRATVRSCPSDYGRQPRPGDIEVTEFSR
ncbi:MAG TPA: hypothetical protein VF259_05735, partial [Solirubrobacterales bacterium]